MTKQITLKKEQLKLLYGTLLLRLYDLHMITPGATAGYFIPISSVRAKLGRGLSLKKRNIMELLYFLNDLGFIDICCKGIKLNYVIKNEKE